MSLCFVAGEKGTLWGRSAARVQRVVVAADAAGYVEGLCSLRSGGDSACGAEGGGIALSGDEYKACVTGLTFQYHMT